MNYYKPRQRKDGRWEYTCQNDGYVRPVGYCTKLPNLESEEVVSWYGESCVKKLKEHKEKYHTCGHETRDEARQCYRRYLLDNLTRIDQGVMSNSPCEVCEKYTKKFARVFERMIPLCEEHNNMETVERIFEAPDEIWSS